MLVRTCAVESAPRLPEGGGTDGTTVRRTLSLSVFGVNPQLRWDCEPVVGACWVYDPRDGSRLFQLAENRDQARDIARTLGRLIRNLQQGSS